MHLITKVDDVFNNSNENIYFLIKIQNVNKVLFASC